MVSFFPSLSLSSLSSLGPWCAPVRHALIIDIRLETNSVDIWLCFTCSKRLIHLSQLLRPELPVYSTPWNLYRWVRNIFLPFFLFIASNKWKDGWLGRGGFVKDSKAMRFHGLAFLFPFRKRKSAGGWLELTDKRILGKREIYPSGKTQIFKAKCGGPVIT